MVNSNSSMFFKEDLSNYTDFREGEPFHQPILDPETHPLSSFESPEEPYLIYEESFDNETRVTDRVIKRTHLSQDNG